jgi:hypothetical protein
VRDHRSQNARLPESLGVDEILMRIGRRFDWSEDPWIDFALELMEAIRAQKTNKPSFLWRGRL